MNVVSYEPRMVLWSRYSDATAHGSENLPMRLADFIELETDSIVDEAEAFAASFVTLGVHWDSAALRDHIPDILAAVVLDLRTSQNAEQQLQKSHGRAKKLDVLRSSAASLHGRLRAKGGFNIDQVVAEYRAIRAAVLRQWIHQGSLDEDAFEDVIRFNEAVDQAVAESVTDFAVEAESWRQVFLGVLGHDLRGPLSVIVTTSELISRMTRDTPVSEHTDRIIRSGRRMNKLLEDLLDHSRTALGMGIRIARTEGDLSAAVQEEVDLLRAGLPGVAVIYAARGPTHGWFDTSRVREALSNLVMNAANYGKPGGDISVSLAADQQSVELIVHNEGSTLSSEALNALFEPMARGRGIEVDTNRTSLGLGLFIVREIARAHGGEVIASSDESSTTFTMRLPRITPLA